MVMCFLLWHLDWKIFYFSQSLTIWYQTFSIKTQVDKMYQSNFIHHVRKFYFQIFWISILPVCVLYGIYRRLVICYFLLLFETGTAAENFRFNHPGGKFGALKRMKLNIFSIVAEELLRNTRFRFRKGGKYETRMQISKLKSRVHVYV